MNKSLQGYRQKLDYSVKSLFFLCGLGIDKCRLFCYIDRFDTNKGAEAGWD